MKQIQFNPRHPVALFCNSHNEKSCLLEFVQMGFNIYVYQFEQEVKVIWQKAPHGEPIPRLRVTPGGRNLYHWIPWVGVPISVP